MSYQGQLFVFLLRYLSNIYKKPLKIAKKYAKKSVYSIIFFTSFAVCFADKNNLQNYSMAYTQNTYKVKIVNFMHMKKCLMKESFDLQSIAKLTYDLSQDLGWEWFDQNAQLELEYKIQFNKKFITKVNFSGMNKVITLDYNAMKKNITNSKSYDQKKQHYQENDTYEKEFVVMRGIITSTFDSMLFNSQEIPAMLQNNVMKFSNEATFKWNKGDKFACLYDRKNFKIMAISLSNNKKKKYAIFFKSKKGENIFNLDGISWQSAKLILHKPVHGKITSPFGYRIHPIFKVRRFHYGVDYGAPRGTPIYAAADGVIKFAGLKGGYGYCIEIQHDKIATLYGHMQRIDKTIYIGKRVNAKEVIGKVGSSGLATGPHLHYEIQVNGTKVNPLTYSAHAYSQLIGEELKMFKKEANKIIKYLE
jgi:murein DD-endopeptidase MepM/ murein hydrolase activator NlpD